MDRAGERRKPKQKPYDDEGGGTDAGIRVYASVGWMGGARPNTSGSKGRLKQNKGVFCPFQRLLKLVDPLRYALA